jgi:hypothetical protein
MRTVAGPSSAVQCELTGGPYTVWSPCAACPGGVPAAVTEARLMTDQDLVQLYEDEQSDENEQREDPDQPE